MVETKSKKKIAIVVVAITIAVIGIIVVLCVILDGKGKSETNIDMELYDNAGAEISEFLSDEKFKELSLEEKCEYAIEQLKSTEGIDPDSVFAGEQEYVFFKYTDGAHGMITLEEQNEFMIGSGDTIEIRLNGSANAKTAKVCEISTPDFGNMQTDEIYENGKPKVLMLDAFSDSGPDTNFTKFSNAWSNAHIDCTYDSDVTLDELATKMADYDMTVILMHGGYSKEHADSLPTVSDPHLIFTHEESSLDVTMKYWNKIITGSIILNPGSNGKTTYVVTGDFFEYYYGKTGVLKDKILFFGSCRSHYMGDQMMKAMGAKAVMGPTESVSNIYFYSILNDMMYGLMSGKNVGESLDLSESINGAHQAEYIEKFYVEIFGREFSAETMQEDFQNSGMTQKDYDDLIKLLSSFHGKNPEFRLCGDTDATLVTLKSEAKTYLDEHIGSETKPEEETTEPEEKDKTALLLSAVLNNEEVWKPASDMMYYEGQTLWFQDLDFDGINELIAGGYGGGTNRLEYYNVYSLHDDTISANQFQLDCYVEQPLLKLCKYNGSEEYFYVNNKAVNNGTGIGMYYELNEYKGMFLAPIVGRYVPDVSSDKNYAYWLDCNYENITEDVYAETYNSFVKNLTEYSYTTDKIRLSEYDKMIRDEKYDRLKKSYDAFAVGKEIGAFDEYLGESVGETTLPNSSVSDAKAHGTFANNLKWELSVDGILTINGEGDMPEYKRDDGPWKSYSDSIYEIQIGNGITRIGSQAFCELENLRKVVMASSVASIGSNAFDECESLSDVQFSENIIRVGSKAFSDTAWYDNQPSGKMIYIGKVAYFYKSKRFINVTKISGESGSSISGYYDSVSNITIRNGTVSIADNAFEECPGLRSVNIPDTVTHIGTAAFSWCVELTSIVIPSSVTELGSGAFTCCTNLEEVSLSPGITKIAGTFYGCRNIKTLTIPNTVTSIGTHAFTFCDSLENLYIPSSVTTIEDYAFYKCNSDMIIHCTTGSYTETYANQKGYTYIADYQ